MSRTWKIVIGVAIALKVVLTAAAVALLCIDMAKLIDPKPAAVNVTFSEFIQRIEDGEIDSVQIDGYVYIGEDRETGRRCQAPGPRSGDPLLQMYYEAAETRERAGNPVRVSYAAFHGDVKTAE